MEIKRKTEISSKALVYVRPWNKDQYRHLCYNAFKDFDVMNVSEHRGYDESGFLRSMALFIEENSDHTAIPEHCSDEELSDIIVRCRLLRNISLCESKRLVNAAIFSAIAMIEKLNPKVILSTTVDSYIIDCLRYAAEKKGVPFIGIVPSFVNGYFRLTSRGEKVDFYEPDDVEVAALVNKLLDATYTPIWLTKSKMSMYLNSFSYWLKNIVKCIYFPIKARKQPLNYHYSASLAVARSHLSVLPTSLHYSGVDLEFLEKNIFGRRRFNFIPLQMSPEATVDYWSSDPTWVDYEKKILDICESKDELFIIKEHPNVVGSRTKDFYRQLKRKKNVLLVSVEIPTNLIVFNADYVTVCTGTVGFEALIRGSVICSTAKPYYLPISFGDTSLNENSYRSKAANKDTANKLEAFNLVKYLLTGLMPGDLVDSRVWNVANPKHVAKNLSVAESIGRYYRSQT